MLIQGIDKLYQYLYTYIFNRILLTIVYSEHDISGMASKRLAVKALISIYKAVTRPEHRNVITIKMILKAVLLFYIDEGTSSAISGQQRIRVSAGQGNQRTTLEFTIGDVATVLRGNGISLNHRQFARYYANAAILMK